jgi:hypothetical protein
LIELILFSAYNAKQLRFATGAKQMKKQIGLAVMMVCIVMSALAYAAEETRFPSKSRTLTAPRPAECKQWTPPKPTTQVDVEFPSDLRGVLRGDAALLVRIGTDGAYLQLVDGLESHPGFIKAAEESVRQWKFSPAVCNGREIVADARVDFQFRSEGAITYGSSSGKAFGVR